MTKYSFEINLGKTESLKRSRKSSFPTCSQIKQLHYFKSVLLHHHFGIVKKNSNILSTHLIYTVQHGEEIP